MLKTLIDYCKENYSRDEKCETCSNTCQGGCLNCLEDIHFSSKSRLYNCSNVTYCYFCHHVYRYASEIHYFFRNIPFELIPGFKVLSIGCGPCTDFIGLINYCNEKGYTGKIDYMGVDLNIIWKNIHERFLNYNNDNIKISFLYENVFNYFDQIDDLENNFSPNVVILQYVLSDMLNHDYDVDIFLNNLVDKIALKMDKGSFIVINDINLGKTKKQPRFYFDTLEKKLNLKGLQTKSLGMHFNNNNKSYTYPYGNTMHPNNTILYEINNEIMEYKPWLFCSSAQKVIKIL